MIVGGLDDNMDVTDSSEILTLFGEPKANCSVQDMSNCEVLLLIFLALYFG